MDQMITVSRELLRQVLVVLAEADSRNALDIWDVSDELRNALEQPAVEQEMRSFQCVRCNREYTEQMPLCECGYGFVRIDQCTAPQTQRPQLLTDDEIRTIYLANGFTVKEGQTDLKPYVFESARAIERAVRHKMGEWE